MEEQLIKDVDVECGGWLAAIWWSVEVPGCGIGELVNSLEENRGVEVEDCRGHGEGNSHPFTRFSVRRWRLHEGV